jgi:uncharacterized membrane protein YiaA
MPIRQNKKKLINMQKSLTKLFFAFLTFICGFVIYAVAKLTQDAFIVTIYAVPAMIVGIWSVALLMSSKLRQYIEIE